MLVLSPLLTVLAVVMIFVMFLVARKLGGNSGKYFVRQQIDLADVTGYVEEQMNGQRVVKVFNPVSYTHLSPRASLPIRKLRIFWTIPS